MPETQAILASTAGPSARSASSCAFPPRRRTRTFSQKLNRGIRKLGERRYEIKRHTLELALGNLGLLSGLVRADARHTRRQTRRIPTVRHQRRWPDGQARAAKRRCSRLRQRSRHRHARPCLERLQQAEDGLPVRTGAGAGGPADVARVCDSVASARGEPGPASMDLRPHRAGADRRGSVRPWLTNARTPGRHEAFVEGFLRRFGPSDKP
jgi:hypothetical protein